MVLSGLPKSVCPLGEGAKNAWIKAEYLKYKTLPKAQQTRGLSSAYQSNFFRSYQKFLHKSSKSQPNTNFKISN